MKSNYKRLGNYIGVVDKRNRNLEIENLIGLSIQKKFIPSISNIIGTDMSTYRILNQNQFSYCSVTSRNGEKITIALYQEEKTAMVSQAYDVFEITNAKELLPEYLMMWFKRPEFDRYARFMSHGSVREMFSWEDMCEVMLPIPKPDKQKEIVKEYNTIVNRIALNNQLIQKLEETAQAIYKQWFVDFEFPNEEGKPYKSNGGEMEMNLELEKEIPIGWAFEKLSKYAECILGGTPSRDKKEYWNGDINWINSGEVNEVRITKPSEKITRLGLTKSATKLLPKKTTVLAITGATLGQVSILEIDACANQSVIGVLENEIFPFEFIFPTIIYFIRELMRSETGGAQPHINKNDVESLKILCPYSDLLLNYKSIINPLYKLIENLSFENDMLIQMNELMLSKLATIEN